MKHIQVFAFFTLAMMTALLAPVVYNPVNAQSTTLNPTQAAKRAARQADRIEDVKKRASDEINRRITSLTDLISRVQNMKKLSDTEKTNFINEINTEINNLKNLQTKINGDTDINTLRTDRKSIFTSYRVYMLFMPQIHLLSAADRMSTVADEMNTIAGKLQQRIDTAKNAGKDTTNAQNALNDMKSKIADAQAQYKTIEDTIPSLMPDNGDTAKINSNKSALENARTLLKKGAQDLKDARLDINTIRTGLK